LVEPKWLNFFRFSVGGVAVSYKYRRCPTKEEKNKVNQKLISIALIWLIIAIAIVETTDTPHTHEEHEPLFTWTRVLVANSSANAVTSNINRKVV
jgi:hypothetical protein